MGGREWVGGWRRLELALTSHNFFLDQTQLAFFDILGKTDLQMHDNTLKVND